MSTVFAQLNVDWNAEPNAPCEHVNTAGSELRLSFFMNAFQYRRFREGDIGTLHFADCWRYRLGSTNDEGWSLGQCRFSRLAPKWGEFYEVTGDLLIDKIKSQWINVRPPIEGSRHFLFYLRDSTFECDASSWRLTVESVDDA